MSSHTTGVIENVYYTLRDPNIGAQSPRDSSFRDQSTWQEGVGVWRTKNLRGREWTGADFARLEAELYSKTYFARVAELYVDADLRALGALTGVAVTGTTTSSRPTVAWSWLPNSDNDLQAAYEVRIYTLAQTLLAGFDPDAGLSSIIPVAETGLTMGAIGEWTSDVDLVNGTSYVAYLRGAQDFNNENWWTGWSTAGFTMAFSPPPTPTLTVAAQYTLPSVRTQLTVESELNQLTAQQSSFEDPAAALGWTAGTSTTVARSTAQAADGAASLALTRTGTTGSATATTPGATSGTPVRPGVTVAGVGSFRAAATARSVRLLINFFDVSGDPIAGTLTGGSVTDTTSGWTQATVTGAAPATAGWMQLQAEVLTAAAAEVHYLDMAGFGVGIGTTWTLGGYGTGDRQVVEYCDRVRGDGPLYNLLHPQLASAGELLGTTDGFFRRGADDTVEVERGLQFQGEQALRWTIGTTSGGPRVDVGSPVGARDEVFSVAVIPGVAQCFSLWARSLTGSNQLRVNLQAVDGAGALVGSATSGATVTVGTTWTQLQVTATPPAGATDWRPNLESVTAAVASILFDGLQLEDASPGGCAPVVPSPWAAGQGLPTVWLPVRGALEALVASARDNLAVVYDREIPPGGLRAYRARNEVAYPDGTVTSSAAAAMVAATRPPVPGPGKWVLKDPYDPGLDSLVEVTGVAELAAEDLTTVHPIRPEELGGDGQRPLTFSDWISGADGHLAVAVLSDREWARVRALLWAKRTLLLQFPEGGQRWIRINQRGWPRTSKTGQVTSASGVDWIREVSLDFIHSRRPRVLA